MSVCAVKSNKISETKAFHQYAYLNVFVTKKNKEYIIKIHKKKYIKGKNIKIHIKKYLNIYHKKNVYGCYSFLAARLFNCAS